MERHRRREWQRPKRLMRQSRRGRGEWVEMEHDDNLARLIPVEPAAAVDFSANDRPYRALNVCRRIARAPARARLTEN